MAYAPPLGSAVDFDLAGGYTPPAGDGVVFDGEPYTPPPLVYAESPDIGIPWGQLPVADGRTGSGWRERRPLSTNCGLGWSKRPVLDCRTDAPWGDRQPLDQGRDLVFGQLAGQIDRKTDGPWLSLKQSDHQRGLPWDPLRGVEHDYGIVDFSPPAKDVAVVLASAAMEPLDLIAFDLPWGNPPQKDRLHNTLWGKEYYDEICRRTYEPPAGAAIGFDLQTPISQVDDGDHIRFYFDQLSYDRRCEQREPSGWRDAYFYRAPGIIPAGVIASWYLVVNTAYLTRLPERTPIDARSMSMGLDLESWCWTFSATLGSDAALELLKPTTSGPMTVEASVNGWIFVFQVDSWRKGSRFGGGDRSVAGRSLSAQLGSPAAETTSYTETQARTANQLAEAPLLDTGFTLDWNLTDWPVPGDVLSYQEQTPIQVIQQIAAAAGGVVQSHRELMEISIIPRYNGLPWAWGAATPALILPESLVIGMDGEWDSRPVYNAAFVAGTVTGGISAKVTRQGTAGDKGAPPITDPLMTHTDCALQRGGAIMAAGGDWSAVRLNLPLMADPVVPGLILPGNIIEVVPAIGQSWRGQTTGNDILVVWGADGLTVRQSVDVERYHGL